MEKVLYSREKSSGKYECHDIAFSDTKAITTLTEDENGILWVGTWKDGVIKYDYRNNKASLLNSRRDQNEKSYGDFVHAFGRDDRGNIWVAYFGKRIEIFNKGKEIARLESHEIVSTRVMNLTRGCAGDMIMGLRKVVFKSFLSMKTIKYCVQKRT